MESFFIYLLIDNLLYSVATIMHGYSYYDAIDIRLPLSTNLQDPRITNDIKTFK